MRPFAWPTLRACLLAEQDRRIARLLEAHPPIDPRHRNLWAGRAYELRRERELRRRLAAS